MLERREIREMDLAAAGSGVIDESRRTGWTFAEWCIVAASAAAWIFIFRTPGPHAGHAGHPSGGALDSGALSSAAMVIAMMLPLVIPHVRHVARSSPGQRGQLAVAAFLLGYLAIWIAAQAAIVAAFGRIASLAGWTLAAGIAMAAAALWELAPTKRRQLLRCDEMTPLESNGWRVEKDCASFGASTGVACVATCWALMAACAAFAHSLPLMAALFGVQMSGRYRRDRSPALAALAVAAACLLSVAARLAGHHAA